MENEFKAWDKNNEEIARVVAIEFHKYLMVPEFITVIYSNTEKVREYADSFELLKYTGLKDKDKTHIYEGNIISAENMYPLLVVIEDGHTLIKWHDESDNVDCTEYLTQQMINDDDLKIIGNKYENQEILEEG